MVGEAIYTDENENENEIEVGKPRVVKSSPKSFSMVGGAISRDKNGNVIQVGKPRVVKSSPKSISMVGEAIYTDEYENENVNEVGKPRVVRILEETEFVYTQKKPEAEGRIKDLIRKNLS